MELEDGYLGNKGVLSIQYSTPSHISSIIESLYRSVVVGLVLNVVISLVGVL